MVIVNYFLPPGHPDYGVYLHAGYSRGESGRSTEGKTVSLHYHSGHSLF